LVIHSLLHLAAVPSPGRGRSSFSVQFLLIDARTAARDLFDMADKAALGGDKLPTSSTGVSDRPVAGAF